MKLMRFLTSNPLGSTVMMFFGIVLGIVLGVYNDLAWLFIFVTLGALVLVAALSKRNDVDAPVRIGFLSQLNALFMAGLIGSVVTKHYSVASFLHRNELEPWYQYIQEPMMLLEILMYVLLGGVFHWLCTAIAMSMISKDQ